MLLDELVHAHNKDQEGVSAERDAGLLATDVLFLELFNDCFCWKRFCDFSSQRVVGLWTCGFSGIYRAFALSLLMQMPDVLASF